VALSLLGLQLDLILKVFSNLNDSMISMLPCFIHRAHISCIFKCQICKSGGGRICTVLPCFNLFSLSTVSAIIIPVCIQWQNSHSLHSVRIISTFLSNRGLPRKKVLLDQSQSYKVSAKQRLPN